MLRYLSPAFFLLHLSSPFSSPSTMTMTTDDTAPAPTPTTNERTLPLTTTTFYLTAHARTWARAGTALYIHTSKRGAVPARCVRACVVGWLGYYFMDGCWFVLLYFVFSVWGRGRGGCGSGWEWGWGWGWSTC
ncbi:hypothetical protein B0H13DRAFT_1966606, partial [Mycena leptocephala]